MSEYKEREIIMSNEYIPIPAFELLKARYRPEDAKKCYDAMTVEERETVKFLTIHLKYRSESRLSNDILEKSLPTSISIDSETFPKRNLVATEKVKDYFMFLGYNAQLLPVIKNSGLSAPILIVSWC